MLTDAHVENVVSAANMRLVMKMMIIALLIFIIFGFSVVADSASLWVAHALASYVPSVHKLLIGGLATGTLPARFFSLALICLPFFLIYLLWRENPEARVRDGARRRGGGSIASFVFAYLVLLPFCIFLLFVVLSAPVGLPDAPHLWGQYLLYGMLNSYFGLLFLGIIFLLAVILCLFMVALFLWLPLMILFNSRLKEI